MPRDNPVWRSEIFGPALAVRTFTTEAEALELADDSDYGLVATVVGGDVGHAERIAARIDAGHVWINSGQVIFPNTAWGGFKASGIGRELGPWGPQRLSRRQAPDHRRAGAAVKVAVIGAGVVGVATAHALARDGHEVVVVERREQAAMESSYGNAGLYSPSDSYAWASPDALKMAVRSLFNRDLGIQYKLRLDPALWLWSLKFLGQCTDAAARRNSLLKLRLTAYSLEQLEAVVQETGVAFGNRREGLLYYFGTADGVAAADHHMGLLRDHGLDLRVLGPRRRARDRARPRPDRRPDRGRASIRPIARPAAATCSRNALAAWCTEHRGTEFRFGETASACAATVTGSPGWTPIGAGSWPMPTCSPRAPTACSSRATWAWHCRSIR